MTAALAIAAIGAVLSLAIYALLAERRAGKATARADVADKSNEVLAANLETMTKARDAEKERGDALDAAIVEHAAAGPVAGSYERLLQARKAASAAGRGSPAVVRDGEPARGAASPVGPDDLLKPGE